MSICLLLREGKKVISIPEEVRYSRAHAHTHSNVVISWYSLPLCTPLSLVSAFLADVRTWSTTLTTTKNDLVFHFYCGKEVLMIDSIDEIKYNAKTTISCQARAEQRRRTNNYKYEEN